MSFVFSQHLIKPETVLSKTQCHYVLKKKKNLPSVHLSYVCVWLFILIKTCIYRYVQHFINKILQHPWSYWPFKFTLDQMASPWMSMYLYINTYIYIIYIYIPFLCMLPGVCVCVFIFVLCYIMFFWNILTEKCQNHKMQFNEWWYIKPIMWPLPRLRNRILTDLKFTN